MKPIPILTACMLLLPAGAGAQLPAMQETGAVRWICGGVGVEERAELSRREQEGNLRLTFVTVKRGGYVADVAVKVTADKSAVPLLEIVSDGPICLLRLPQGRYRIEAGLAGARRSAIATIGSESRAPQRLVFAFPPEPWDGVWASEEEKRQAREP